MTNERGKTIRTEVVETNGQSLVEFIRLVPGRRPLCIEEGEQRQWLHEILSPHVHEIAVVLGEKIRGNKNDGFGCSEAGGEAGGEDARGLSGAANIQGNDGHDRDERAGQAEPQPSGADQAPDVVDPKHLGAADQGLA